MSITTTTPASTDRRDRLLYAALWATAALGYAGLVAADQGLAAVAAFGGFGLLAVAFHATRSGSLFDERDERVLNEASGQTIRVVGLVSAVLFPSLVVLDALGEWAWTPFMAGVATVVTAVFALWLVMNLLVRRGR